LPGIRAVALDADLGAEQPLGSVELSPDGRFEIHYTVESFGADEAGTADIVVRVVDASGKVLGQSRNYTPPPGRAGHRRSRHRPAPAAHGVGGPPGPHRTVTLQDSAIDVVH
jgi:hypothetical protein